jgi:hypothetical protein
MLLSWKNNHLIEALRLDDSLGNFSRGKPSFPECTAGIKLACSLKGPKHEIFESGFFTQIRAYG